MSDTEETALITGASSGIGKALARRFARSGHGVVLVARREQRLRTLATELEREHGVETAVVVADLATPDGADRLYETIRERGIRIDILVNNAGIGTQGRFVETDLDTERDELQLNVVTPTVLTKLFGREMGARGHGRVLNVASSAAFQPGPFMAVYYASKSYLLSFSEAIAEELREEGVIVSVLCPGPVRTEFQDRAGASNIPLMSRTQDVRAVADAGYEGLMAGEVVIVPGIVFTLLSHTVGMVPRSLVRKTVRWINGG
ncbi:MAG TPA: SDR family oxidoreductase [Halococcus sp.]|nr:SDR family oxidoreductase [Halococcus sp.]